MDKEYTDREWQLLHHIDTLTTAVEDALSQISFMLSFGKSGAINEYNIRLLQRTLEHSLDSTWDKTDGNSR